uniref:Uncharacterized protein n=1 Tax=Anguilla anguilla TaxID=7936 RepID=A0A0E9TGN9_ANGAN
MSSFMCPIVSFPRCVDTSSTRRSRARLLTNNVAFKSR